MRINLLTATCFLSASVLSASCGMVDCVKGTGDAVKKDLSVSAFHGIDVQGAVDVQLSRADAQHVTVEAQANIAELLETSVSNGIWTIRTRACYSTDKPFVVHISVPSIDRVHVQGSGDVTGTDAFDVESADIEVQGSGDIKLHLNAKKIEAEIQGSGDVVLHGSASELECSIQGSGDVKALELNTGRTTAHITGSGDVGVTVSTSLTASITGSGNVKYRGSPPEVHSDVTGSGNVEPVK